MPDTEIREKLAVLMLRVEQAEARMLATESLVRTSLHEIHNDLKELNAHMNRGKGWGAAIIVIAGLAGAFFGEIIASILKIKGG